MDCTQNVLRIIAKEGSRKCLVYDYFLTKSEPKYSCNRNTYEKKTCIFSTFPAKIFGASVNWRKKKVKYTILCIK